MEGRFAENNSKPEEKVGQPDNKNDKSGRNTEEKKATAYKIDTTSHQVAGGILHWMIVPVTVSYKNNPEEVTTYAMLDNMSDACFIKEDLIKELKAESTLKSLEVTTLLKKRVTATEVVEDLIVRGTGESTMIELPKVYGREEIDMERGLIHKPDTVRRWPHLQDVAENLPPYQEDFETGLFIGANCSAAMMPKKIVAGGDHEPYALKTALGWGGGVIGWVQGPEVPDCNTHFVTRTANKETSPLEIHKMFLVKFIENSTGAKQSAEDRQFLEMARAEIRKCTDGHFELPLPVREDTRLPNNKTIATKRLKQLKGRMFRDQKYKEDYMAFINVLQKGYAELVLTDELEGNPGQVWYISHHGVYHPRKPEKIRIVYDCSAEYQGESLNHHLLQGPDLTNDLTGILCRS